MYSERRKTVNSMKNSMKNSMENNMENNMSDLNLKTAADEKKNTAEVKKNKKDKVKARNERISMKARESAAISVIKKCGRLDSKTDESFFLNFIKNLSLRRKFIKPLKHKISEVKDESVIFYGLSYIGKLLLSLELPYYGTFFLLFGVVSFLTEIVKTLIFTNNIFNSDLSVIACSLSLVITAMILLFGGKAKTLSDGITSSSILSFFLFTLFGVRKECVIVKKRTSGGLLFVILAGISLGFMTLLESPQDILFKILILILGIIIFNVPESGVVMTLLFAPFLSVFWLVVITLYVWFCYIMKLLVGRRSFKPTFTDGVVIFLGIIILSGGIVGVGEKNIFKGMAGLWLIMCFILVSTLIKNRHWVERCRNAAAISTVVSGVIYAFGSIAYKITDEFFLDNDILVSLVSGLPVFDLNSGLILLLGIFFVFSYYHTCDRARRKLGLLILSVILAGGIFLTYSWEVWLSFIIGTALYSVSIKPKTIYIFVIALISVVVAFFVIPEGMLEQVYEIAGFSEQEILCKLQNQKALFEVGAHNFMAGVGYSDVFLKTEVSALLPVGFDLMVYNSGTPALMLAESGILAVFVYVLVFLMIFGSYLIWGRNEKANKKTALTGTCGICMITAVAVYGIFDNLFLNTTAALIFWLVSGLVYASCKVLREEANHLEKKEEKVYYVSAEVLSSLKIENSAKGEDDIREHTVNFKGEDGTKGENHDG